MTVLSSVYASLDERELCHHCTSSCHFFICRLQLNVFALCCKFDHMTALSQAKVPYSCPRRDSDCPWPSNPKLSASSQTTECESKQAALVQNFLLFPSSEQLALAVPSVCIVCSYCVLLRPQRATRAEMGALMKMGMWAVSWTPRVAQKADPLTTAMRTGGAAEAGRTAVGSAGPRTRCGHWSGCCGCASRAGGSKTGRSGLLWGNGSKQPIYSLCRRLCVLPESHCCWAQIEKHD